MGKNQRAQRYIAVSVVAMLAIIFMYLGTRAPEPEPQSLEVSEDPIPATLTKSESVMPVHAQYAFDPDDIGMLVKNSDNIFVGKVIKKVGEEEVGTLISPVFEVRVLSNIKGDAEDVIRLRQSDVGFRGNTMFVMSGDISYPITGTDGKGFLLQADSTYVFMTRFSSSKNLYGISMPAHDRKLITTDAALDDLQLVDRADGDSLVKELRLIVSRGF